MLRNKQNALIVLVLALLAMILLTHKGNNGVEADPLDVARQAVYDEAMNDNLFRSKATAHDEQNEFDRRCRLICADQKYSAAQESYWCVRPDHCDSSFTRHEEFKRNLGTADDFTGCCCCGESDPSCAGSLNPFGWVPGFGGQFYD